MKEKNKENHPFQKGLQPEKEVNLRAKDEESVINIKNELYFLKSENNILSYYYFTLKNLKYSKEYLNINNLYINSKNYVRKNYFLNSKLNCLDKDKQSTTNKEEVQKNEDSYQNKIFIYPNIYINNIINTIYNNNFISINNNGEEKYHINNKITEELEKAYTDIQVDKMEENTNIIQKNGKRGWICKICNNFNYESRKKCNQCGNGMIPTIINSNINQNQESKTVNHKKGDWMCLNCSNINFSFRKFCNICKIPKLKMGEIYQFKKQFRLNTFFFPIMFSNYDKFQELSSKTIYKTKNENK